MEWVSSGGSDNFEGEQTWKPEGPGELVGKLVAKSTINLPEKKGGPTVLLKIEDSDGQVWAVWASRLALRTLVEEHDEDLVLGREVGIRALEMIKTQSGNDFVPYEMGFGGPSTGQLAAVGANRTDDDDVF